MASVLIAAGSLLVSSFLTRSVVGLVLVHGIVFGSACALGFIVSQALGCFSNLEKLTGRLHIRYPVNTFSSAEGYLLVWPHVVQESEVQQWLW